MTTKLIPLKLITDGSNGFSFINNKRKPQNLIWLKESIEKDGLFYPLVVRQIGKEFSVIDGKKRLKVIRNLAKSKLYNRSLAKVPCIVQESHEMPPLVTMRPTLMTEPELAHQIIRAAQQHVSIVSIAQRFDCDLSVVKDCISLTKLNPELLMHFNNNVISLDQAAAFATIENKTAQLDLLHQLGPSVSDKDIIAAIKAGSTVLEISDDHIIFLPSRGPHKPSDSAQKQNFGKPKQAREFAFGIAA